MQHTMLKQMMNSVTHCNKLRIKDENLVGIQVGEQPFDKRLTKLILVNGGLTMLWLSSLKN